MQVRRFRLTALLLVIPLLLLGAPALAWYSDAGPGAIKLAADENAPAGAVQSPAEVVPSVASKAFLPLIMKPGNGNVSGLVKNAVNAQPIAGASVCVLDTTQCATTNASGQYSLTNIQAGLRTLRATANGFVSLEQTVMVVSGQTATANFDLSPSLTQGEIRIVLSWGENPEDLDSHLWLPTSNQYHVYWWDEGDCSAFPFACLDVDDVTSYGPETITIKQRYPGTYVYGVYHYTGSGTLATSGAHVRVYGSSGLLRDFAVPSGSGLWWHVFNLDAAGNIVVFNSISDTSPGPYDPDGGTLLMAQGSPKSSGQAP